VFYPQPYLGQLVRKIPIAVVDDDRTPLSRRLIQALDADEAISVAVRAPALDVAQQALFDRRVFGILEIPPDTEREVLKGNEVRIPAYVDSAYFLVFNRTLQRPPGVVQPTEIKIAPKISGRLLRFAVAPGQSMRKGDALAELSNPELEAGLVLAQAELGQARAARDRIYAGPRQQQVDALARDIDMANANLVYARQQFSRTSQLTAAGFASHQDLDKATAAVETGNANLSGAKERYEAARFGPTREERAIADATVEVTAAAVAVIAARVAKSRIRAPSDGAVALLVAEPGEAIVPGQPLMTLQKVGELGQLQFARRSARWFEYWLSGRADARRRHGADRCPD